MRYYIIGALCIAAIGYAPITAAQSYDFNNQNRKDLGLTAGFNLTLPLGQSRKDKTADKARIGFQLGLSQRYDAPNRPTPQLRSTGILTLGISLDGHPSLLMNGQDIYAPFLATHRTQADDNGAEGTNQTDDDNRASTGTVLGAIGLASVVVIGGAAIAINSIDTD